MSSPLPDAVASSQAELDPCRLGPARGSRMVVLGGCGAIGRALVRSALAADLRVAVWDLPASLTRHPPPDAVTRHAFDATDETAYPAALQGLPRDWDGAVDILVALAGFTVGNAPVESLSTATWDEVLDGNLRSTFLVNRAVLPLLRASGAGAIINMASGLAIRAAPGYGAYSAAKAGVLALTRMIAAEAAPTVRANAVAPSAVDTAFLRGGTGRGDEDGQAARLDVAAYARSLPLQRIANPDDIVGPILFLAGPASRYMTGQVLHINAGSVTP
ncbi:MAG: SDR family oxidoreductase [Burkholderiaceae bacterium]